MGVIGGVQGTTIAQLPSYCHPKKRLVFNMNHWDRTARVDVLPSGEIIWISGVQRYDWVSLSGIAFSVGKLDTLTLMNGWSPYAFYKGIYGTPSVTLQGDICIVDGLVIGGVRGTTIAQLPSNCHPKKRLVFNMNHHDLTARVDVLPSGEIIWIAGVQRYHFLSLSGIAFSVGKLDTLLTLMNGWSPLGGDYGYGTPS